MKVLNKRKDKIPEGAVYVGRPSKWGNPFTIGKDGNREQVITAFMAYASLKLQSNPHWLDEIKGKDLVCWCSPLPCHADVLMELANYEA
jgi:hypothetical protein